MADSPKRRHGGGKPVIELAGQRFGSMLVIDRAEKPATRSFSPGKEAWWRCRCGADQHSRPGRYLAVSLPPRHSGRWIVGTYPAAAGSTDPAEAAADAPTAAAFSDPAWPGFRAAALGR